MSTVLLTGSQGFIATYICCELLNNGYQVIGVDDFSKYGQVIRPQDNHPNFLFDQVDIVKNYVHLENLVYHYKPKYIISCAAKIGGIAYFNEHSYEILHDNEAIMSNVCDAAIYAHKSYGLKRFINISSSMVFEQTKIYPTPETEINNCSPPLSSYGFQKLATEYWTRELYRSFKIPYTIIRPFNAVGAFEDEAKDEKIIMSGNIKLMMSHVLPDYVNKSLKKQSPFRILGTGKQIRHLTNGKDIAHAIRLAMESDKAINEDFNISHSEPINMLDLAKRVWEKVNPIKEFIYELEPGYEFDVQVRSPSVEKAKNLLGFEAKISIDQSIDEVVNYIKTKEERNIQKYSNL